MATAPLPPSGLVAACDDSRLLAFPLWPLQRQILESVERAGRIHVLACGRRSGKTSLGALIAVWDACLRPELARHVRKGERRFAVCVAVNLAQARLFVAAAKSIVEASPMLSRLVTSVTDDSIEFSTGCTIAAFPCTSRGARGWPISTLLLDEFAHHVDGEGNSSSEAVWKALTPSVAQFGNEGRIVVASTPWGAEGAFADLFHRAEAGEIADAVAHHATSAQANPTLSPDFLRGELERDSEAFATEFEARFAAGGGSFIAADRIAAAVAVRGELGRLDAVDWIAGLDPGFTSDPFGLAIVGRDSADPRLLRLGVARAWAPTKAASFDERRLVEDSTLNEISEVCRYYDVTRCVTDQHLAPAVVAYLSARGLRVETVTMTASSKTLAYQELRERISQGTLELYEHPGLTSELRRLRVRYAAGRSSVVSPRVGGSHGDLAQALALAVFKHRNAHAASLSGEFQWDPAPENPWVGLPDRAKGFF